MRVRGHLSFSSLLLEQLPGLRLPQTEHAIHEGPHRDTIGKYTQHAEGQVVVDVIGQTRRAVSEIIEAVLMHPASEGAREHAVDDERRLDDALGLHAPGLPQGGGPQANDDLDLIALAERKRAPHLDDGHRSRSDARSVARIEMEGEDSADRSSHHAGSFEERHACMVGARAVTGPVW